MATAVDRAVVRLPFTTKTHALEEGQRDPRFWSYFSPLATSSNPATAVDDDMKKAVINELDPRRYSESKGKWPVLRTKVRATLKGIGQHYSAHGTLDGLARFIAGLGQEDVPGLVTSLNMEETGAQAPMPGLVTSYDTETPSSGVPGLVTSLSPDSSGAQAPFQDPSAGAESAAFKESLDTPSKPAVAEPTPVRATVSAPVPIQKAPAPAPASTSPSIWATIASALSTAGAAGAKIYGQQVQQSAVNQAQQTLAQAQATAAQRAQQAALIASQGAGTASNISSYALYGVLGLAGVGGLIMLFKAMQSRGGKGR